MLPVSVLLKPNRARRRQTLKFSYIGSQTTVNREFEGFAADVSSRPVALEPALENLTVKRAGRLEPWIPFGLVIRQRPESGGANHHDFTGCFKTGETPTSIFDHDGSRLETRLPANSARDGNANR